MIGIIDYGMGNLHSVTSACSHLGLETKIGSSPAELEDCSKLILPGVGAFEDMIGALHKNCLYTWLLKKVKEDRIPLLGICLGMQALYERSFEFGEHEGLGLLQGSVKAMEPIEFHEDGTVITLPVPQIGWNRLYCASNFPIAKEIEADPYVYFDHSYAGMDWNPSELAAYCSYGPYTVPAIVWKDNVLGCQFHPEKSGTTGLRILEWFGKEFGA